MINPIHDVRVVTEEFRDSTDELHYHLIRAEHHAKKAHDLLYERDGPKRSMWFRLLAGRAQSILMGLYVQEVNRRGRQ